jgi:hypothetical protein
MASCQQGLLVKGKATAQVTATVQVMTAVQVNGKLSKSGLLLVNTFETLSSTNSLAEWGARHRDAQSTRGVTDEVLARALQAEEEDEAFFMPQVEEDTQEDAQEDAQKALAAVAMTRERD